MTHCSACPVATWLHCVGEDAPRICDLVNPVHPAHVPGYADTVKANAEDPDAIIARMERAMKAYAALPPGERRGCCG